MKAGLQVIAKALGATASRPGVIDPFRDGLRRCRLRTTKSDILDWGDRSLRVWFN
jgi:hypothetical protein